jgi:hypothetical protein
VTARPLTVLGCCHKAGAWHHSGLGSRDLEKQMRALPSPDPMDPGYRRLRYLR